MLGFLKRLTTIRHAFAGGSFFAGESVTKRRMRREINHGLDSSVVMAPIQWMQRAVMEAEPEVRMFVKEELQTVPQHPLTQLLEKPNPFYSGIHLMQASLFSWVIDGNAYWAVLRNMQGRPVQLWYIPHWLIEPKFPQSGTEFISHYEYRPAGMPVRLEPEDVVHFRHSINPQNPRVGISPVDSAIREIWVDMDASQFVADLLANGAIPGTIISPSGEAQTLPDDVSEVKKYVERTFRRSGRGRTLVLGAPTNVTEFGFSPEQMNMAAIRNTAEERICALLGIPASVVGFGTGLEQTKVGATMEESVKLAWNNGILPILKLMAGEVNQSLMPGFRRGGRTERFRFNTEKVQALQEDRDKRSDRTINQFRAAVITRAQAKEQLGMVPAPGDEVYLQPISMIEVPAVPPEPVPSGQPAEEGERESTRDREPLNGAQVEALMNVVREVAQGLMPRDTGVAVIAAAFPITREEAEAIMGDVGGSFTIQPGEIEENAWQDFEAKVRTRIKSQHSLTEERIAENAPRVRNVPSRLRQAVEAMERLQGNQEKRFRKAMVDFFEDFGRDLEGIAREVIEPKQAGEDQVIAGQILERADMNRRKELFKEAYQRQYLAVAEEISSVVGEIMDVAVDLPDAVQRAIIEVGGRRAGLIDLDRQTRQALFRTLTNARADGLGPPQIARMIRDRVPAGPWANTDIRGRVIARTETKFAQNASTLERAKAEGIQRAMVFDNRTGFGDDVCSDLDGRVVTLDEAEALMGDEHPNGTRSFTPISDTLADELGV